MVRLNDGETRTRIHRFGFPIVESGHILQLKINHAKCLKMSAIVNCKLSFMAERAHPR